MVLQAAGRLLARLGLLGWMDRRTHAKPVLWLRSLFAVYDIDQMDALDVPWWCLDAMRQVDAFLADRPGARVFEYGSGASSLWLARRAGHVTSVEHDRDWYATIAARAAAHANLEVRLEPPEQATGPVEPRYLSDKPGWRGRSFQRYVTSIERAAGPFDLIVIDGRCRSGCLELAAGHLKADGMIVFDNVTRRRYRRAVDASGLSARVFRGLAACLPYPDSTALLVHGPRARD